MANVLNVSGYRFVPLDGLTALRERLHAAALARALRGTVLLAPEGINLFVAGAPEPLRDWLDALRSDERFIGLQAKESWSETTPLRRLKVKIKPEIIRMNRPAIRPTDGRAPALEASTLARWLSQGHDDQGRPVAMLDTRNAFEVDAGTFDGAIDWRLGRFSDFPAALDAHREQLAGKTVVSFCTGGIRCEKAALLMRARGVASVLQLDGGILKYFEATAGAAPGWRGDCVVFDERGALAPDLSPATVPTPAHRNA